MSKSFYSNGATPSSSKETTGYFSIEEKIIIGPPGQGVPSGGGDKMLLVKSSGDDFDTEWTSNLDNIVIDANLSGGYF